MRRGGTTVQCAPSSHAPSCPLSSSTAPQKLSLCLPEAGEAVSLPLLSLVQRLVVRPLVGSPPRMQSLYPLLARVPGWRCWAWIEIGAWVVQWQFIKCML